MGTTQEVGVVDYGTGNITSVVRSLERLGVRAVVASSPADLEHADKLVLPGIGHFGRTMEQLRRRELLTPLHEAARVRQIPILGICLGMQLMMTHGEEGDAPGLAWIEGSAIRFRVSDTRRYKIPNIGWSRVAVNKRAPLFDGVAEDAEFYYAHAYTVAAVPPDAIAGESEYSRRFTAAIADGNLFGVQFHPEKSYQCGQRVLQNFVRL